VLGRIHTRHHAGAIPPIEFIDRQLSRRDNTHTHTHTHTHMHRLCSKVKLARAWCEKGR
jgi:hypothetical protein